MQKTRPEKIAMALAWQRLIAFLEVRAPELVLEGIKGHRQVQRREVMKIRAIELAATVCLL